MRLYVTRTKSTIFLTLQGILLSPSTPAPQPFGVFFQVGDNSVSWAVDVPGEQKAL